jgi:hypothetical protein
VKTAPQIVAIAGSVLAASSFGNYRVTQHGDSEMRAETQSVVDEIKRSVGLLRRAL